MPLWGLEGRYYLLSGHLRLINVLVQCQYHSLCETRAARTNYDWEEKALSNATTNWTRRQLLSLLQCVGATGVSLELA